MHAPVAQGYFMFYLTFWTVHRIVLNKTFHAFLTKGMATWKYPRNMSSSLPSISKIKNFCVNFLSINSIITKSMTINMGHFTNLTVKQECIPVGCIPSAAVAICWEGGCLLRGMSAQRGPSACWDTPPRGHNS